MLNDEKLQRLVAAAEYCKTRPWPEFFPGVRPDMVQGLGAYVREGRPLGHFLRAVVEDRLMESFARADSDNARSMLEIVQLVYNHLPLECRGENYSLWLEAHDELRKRQGVQA